MANPLNLPSHDDIIELVKVEGKIRMSKEYIDECDKVADEPNGWLRITGEMQKRIVNEHGFKGTSADIALNMLRRAQYLYPDNEHVKDLVYVKNNKANKGRFKNGDKIEDIKLYDITGKCGLNYMNLLQKGKVNVVLAASHT